MSPVIIQVDGCLFAVAVCIGNVESCLSRTNDLGGLMHNVTILVANDNGHIDYGTVGLDGYIVAVYIYNRNRITVIIHRCVSWTNYSEFNILAESITC